MALSLKMSIVTYFEINLFFIFVSDTQFSIGYEQSTFLKASFVENMLAFTVWFYIDLTYIHVDVFFISEK